MSTAGYVREEIKRATEAARDAAAARRARIRRIAAENPDLPFCLLMERFGATAKEIEHALAENP